MNGGGEKMNISGEKMISELPSCLKLKNSAGIPNEYYSVELSAAELQSK